MAKVLLDTNFILSCVRNKLDFFDELTFRGYKILIPKQVFAELDGISRSKQKMHSRDDAHFALKMLEKEEKSYEEIDMGKGNVDNSIVNYSKNNKEVIIATLDSELKKKITSRKMVIREKKRLEVV